MSVVAVLEVIGERIEELRRENEALKIRNENLMQSRDSAYKTLCDVQRERDELKLKIKTVQDYADSLAEQCENMNKPEVLHALSFTGDTEIASKTE